MARTTPRPLPTATQTLQPLLRHCPTCGEAMWAAYHHYRPLTTLAAVLRLTRQMRRGLNQTCRHFRAPYRPEQEGRFALPKHACGLDVLAFIGQQRSGHHRRVPAIHQALVERGVAVAPRTGTHLWARYDELLALSRQEPPGSSAAPRPAAASSWPVTAGTPLWAMPSSGSCALASPARCSWPVACSPPPRRTSPRSGTRGSTPCRGPLSGSFLMASLLSARPWRRPCRACRTSGVPAIPCAQRPRSSMKPTARARKHGKSGGVGCGPLRAHGRGAPPPRPRSDAVPVAPCAVPSPPMGAHLLRPQASRSMTASVPAAPAASGWKKGGRAQGTGPPEDEPAARAGGDCLGVARHPCGLSRGAPRRAPPAQRRPVRGAHGETAPARAARGHGAAPRDRRHGGAGGRSLAHGQPQLWPRSVPL
jgi:hypothetical protein